MSKYLGIDYGKKKTGVAISEGYLAEPYKILKTSSQNELVIKIKAIIKNKNVDKVVIGIPQGQLVSEIKDFAKKIKKNSSVDVFFEDETLTSKDAVKKMIEAGKPLKKRRKQEDLFAACLILQSYLDET